MTYTSRQPKWLLGKYPVRTARSLVARLLAGLRVDPVSGCWLWIGGRNGHGYGQIHVRGRKRCVHVLLWELWNGRSVPPGKELDHFRCDNPPCGNPRHVRPVTHRENLLRGATHAARRAALEFPPR